MSTLTKTTARVLKRRIQRFNENNPERAIQIPTKITTDYQYKTLNTKLDKAVKLTTTNKKIKDLVGKELQTRITTLRDLSTVEPMKYKLYKTQKAADKELERVRVVRKEQLKFIQAQKRFISSVEKYNGELGHKHSRRFSFLPRNNEELKRGKEAFKAAKANDLKAVRDALRVGRRKATRVMDSGRVKYDVLTVTAAAEAASFNKHGGLRIQDIRLLYSFRQAIASTNIPELEELVDEGGISFVLDVINGGYGIAFIYDDTNFDEIRPMYYLEQIASALRGNKSSNPRSQMILENFVNRHKDKL